MNRTPEKKNEKNKRKTIFIHSLYRTGSTYVWNKFRQGKKYRCYYDPFHQGMGSIDKENPNLENLLIPNAHRLRHPVLEREYTDEYIKLLGPGSKGVPFFKKSFTADDYCNNGDNPEQKEYIDFLIDSAGEQAPVFKFNLSPLRSAWFKKNYPDALHLYLLRNPRNQFQSYLDMYRDQFPVFLVNDFIVSGVNRNSPFFKPLAAQIPLLEHHYEHFEDEYYIYNRLIPLYSDYEKYFIFYYIWFSALVENVLNSDIILNIDRIDTSWPYRKAVCEELQNRGAPGIDFDDAVPWEYKKYALKKSELNQVEKTIHALVLRRYPNRKFELFDKRLETHNRKYFDLETDTMSFLRKRPLEPGNFLQDLGKKYDRLAQIFSSHLLESKQTTGQSSQDTREDPGLVSGMAQELTLKRKELTEKIQLLREKDRNLLQKEHSLITKNLEIAKIERQREQDLETYRKEVDEKEELIKRLKSRKEILDLAMKLHEKEKALEQKEWEIKDMGLRLQHKEETYEADRQQKDKAIGQNDQLIAGMKQKLALNSESLTEMERQLNQKQNQLTRKTQVLEKNEKLLGWRDRQIEEKDQIVEKKDIRIAALIKEKNMHLNQIEEKDKLIDVLAEELRWVSSNKLISLIRKIFRPSI